MANSSASFEASLYLEYMGHHLFNFTVLNLTALYPNAVITKAQIKQNILRKFKAVLHKVARMTMTPHTAHHGRTWLIMPISNGWSSGNMSRNVL